MTDKPDSPTISEFNRRTFIAGGAGTAVVPIAVSVSSGAVQ
jgi:hypothetical protein